MGDNLDRIATVNISIESPVSKEDAFDNILIMGAAPTSPKGSPKQIDRYNSLNDVIAIGYDTATEPVGIAARLAFSQTPRPSCIYIATVGTSENITDVLGKVFDTQGWYCLVPVGFDKTKMTSIIQAVETSNKICVYADPSYASPYVAKGLYYRSAAIYPCTEDGQNTEDIPVDNLHGIAAAWATRCMSIHAGGETWALKTLTDIQPANLKATAMNALDAQNMSYCIYVASKSITQGGKTNAGEWIDVIRFRDWLQNDMQTRIVNLLASNDKIPYTNAGIALIQNQMIASLKAGQEYGGIRETEYDDEGNEYLGFITSVPSASSISAEVKATRVLTDCTFNARIAGAIHVVDIAGCLTYETL